MLELYLLIVAFTASPNPKVTVYQNEQQACAGFDSAADQAGAVPHVYKETQDRRGAVNIEEGSCKSIKQFSVK